jgi:hypothetical protein
MKVPRYDQARDGCPFAWCMTAAAAERAHRQDVARSHAEMQARAHAANVARLKRAEAAMERPTRGG